MALSDKEHHLLRIIFFHTSTSKPPASSILSRNDLGVLLCLISILNGVKEELVELLVVWLSLSIIVLIMTDIQGDYITTKHCIQRILYRHQDLSSIRCDPQLSHPTSSAYVRGYGRQVQPSPSTVGRTGVDHIRLHYP